MNSDSKAKHTAGPWRAVIPAGYGKDTLIMIGTDIVASLIKFEGKAANARLISEAPTLKDALSSARVVLARMRRSMMAHPDHEVGSEFDDLTTESQILEDEIMELIRRIKG